MKLLILNKIYLWKFNYYKILLLQEKKEELKGVQKDLSATKKALSKYQEHQK